MKYFNTTTILSTVVALALVIGAYHVYKMYGGSDASISSPTAESAV